GYVLGLLGPLQAFYNAAGLHKIWLAHKFDYDSLVERFHEPVAGLLLRTDLYLRNQLSGYLGRRYIVYLEPQAAPGQVNARNYAADYFLVLSPSGRNMNLDAVRHTYLHYSLDPLLMRRGRQGSRR